MILYFADRKMEIIGRASTSLPDGLIVIEDVRTADIETGAVIFECKIPFDSNTRALVEKCAEVGNYLLRSYRGKNEFYTIIDAEIDTGKQTIYVYAEDAGMDLLNDVVGEYEADKAYPIAHYINMYAEKAGFQIGKNEVSSLTRQLSLTDEETASARLLKIAEGFECEISFSFDIKGLVVNKKYVNIHKKRGQDAGVTLRLNSDIDSIITSKSIGNLATALQCTGGTPDGADDPITLKYYTYDDGDFYVDGTILKSRKALEKWSRILWKTDTANSTGGHIVKQFSHDTTSPAELFSHAKKELTTLREMEVNYEVDITVLPDNVDVGDRINIVDEQGKLYLSTRILTLEESEANQTFKAVLGEHRIKSGGISQKVLDLAAKFSAQAQSAARALKIANTAKTAADEAQAKADAAVTDAANAQTKANEAQQAAETATQSAQQAQQAANNAQNAVDTVEKDVEELDETLTGVKLAAEKAQEDVENAVTLSNAANEAAQKAKEDAQTAIEGMETATEKADTAITKAETAEATAGEAKTTAEAASVTAQAAKQDAENAEKDILSLGDRLDTVSNTMTAEYARKSDLTETEASLSTRIEQNAAEIQSTASRVQTIDETANNAKELSEAANLTAEQATAKADQATADAEAAQSAADEAKAAATSAQTEADNAKTAAQQAQNKADQAEADLTEAKNNLATVTSRVDATEADIVAAQNAVNAAQAAADKAQEDADTAAQKAADAQSVADTAVENAATAQNSANEAISKAAIAQAAANEAKGDAAEAQAKAEEAAQQAATAQQTANTAKTNADNAQAKANEAATAAATAQQMADEADAKAAQAATDLETAKQNLVNVTSRVDATEAEVEAAQKAVETAQAAADQAKTDAENAQETADTAKANAATAQTAADNAKNAADTAQAAADEARAAADKAQEDVNSLAVRVTTAETSIRQNSEEIEARATKTELAQTLGGYYTKDQTDAAIKIKSDEITSEVSRTYEMVGSRGEQLITNGNGLLGDNTNFSAWEFDGATANNSPGSFTAPAGTRLSAVTTDEFIALNPDKHYTLSLDFKSKEKKGTMAAYVAFYDVDKNAIQAPNHMFISGTLTTLAQDLKKGDTVAYLSDVSKWTAQTRYAINLTVWNYTNSFGYTYPAETYSRTQIRMKNASDFPVDGAIDYENNTITLQAAWNGATIPAGTQVSQGTSGSTYKYMPGTLLNTVPTEWKTYSGVYSGIDYSGTNKSEMFPPGTAYTKLGFLWNYNSSTDQLWVTNITLQDTTADNDLKNRLSTAETAISQNSKEIALRATKTEVENIKVGGRNLVIGSSDTWTDINVGQWTIALRHASANKTNEFTYHYSDYGIKAGDYITFAIDLNAINKRIAIRVDYWSETGSTAKFGNYIEAGTQGRSVLTLQAREDMPYFKLYIGSDGKTSGTTTEQYKCFKVEKGNKATDWTPAPEDVEQSIADTESALQNTIAKKESSIIAEAEGITQRHLSEYTKDKDFQEVKSAVTNLTDASFSVQIETLKEEYKKVNEELQALKSQIQKNFDFTLNGLIIHGGGGNNKLQIDDDEGIVFTESGNEQSRMQGSDFMNDNIYVEKLLHIGGEESEYADGNGKTRKKLVGGIEAIYNKAENKIIWQLGG